MGDILGDSVLIAGTDLTAQRAADDAHLAMFDPRVMLAGQTMYVATTAAIYWFYRGVVPPSSMNAWLMISISGLSLSLLFCAAFFMRRPGQAETLNFWRKIDKRLTHVFDLIAVASIFLLFQHGNEGHRLVALAYCVGYGPMQLITDPENLWANRISVVVILGAFAIQLFRMDHDAALILTVMFCLYGSLLLYAAGVFHNAFESTVSQKAQSEAHSKALSAALAEVSSSRDAKTRFIANASHDLGHPLQAASLFTNELAKDIGTSAASTTLSLLKQSISGAQNLVLHMLQYLRLEADSVQPNLSIVKLQDVFGLVTEQRKLQAAQNSISLVFAPTTQIIRTDLSLLIRALDNLIGNALVHSGGTKVLVGCRPKGTTVQIWVLDDGKGIPLRLHETVFEDFAQGDNLHKGGFGLGLASVRRTAKLLGGRAAIYPKWTNGCAAFIELTRA
jgi:two-component system, sensor histidine kinase